MVHKYDVAGLGNAIVDVIAPTTDGFLLEHNVAKGVMTLIDEFRAHQLLKALPGGQEIAGGSAANTMAGIASFGGKGIYMGKVKADRLGESFAEGMKAIGVDYTTKPASEGAQTACCMIWVTPDGHRSMSTYLGATRGITPDDIDEAAIAASQVLYVEGYLWDEPKAKTAIEKAMSAAKKAHCKVAFTLSDPFCVERWRDEFRELIETKIDILFANEDEAMAQFEADDFDQVLQAARGWNGVAALTRSEKGCVIVDDEVHVLDAEPVAKVLDTTGAGDQFAAGFLYGFTHGKPLAVCGRLGAIAAAEVISHFGGRPEMHLKALAADANLI